MVLCVVLVMKLLPMHAVLASSDHATLLIVTVLDAPQYDKEFLKGHKQL